MTKAMHEQYVDFVCKLSHYVAAQKMYSNNITINDADFHTQLSKIMYEYICLNVKLVADLSTINRYQFFKNINVNILQKTKIVCMERETLFNDIREEYKLKKYTKNENKNIQDYNPPLWIVFDNNIIIGFDLKMKKFVKKYLNQVDDIYSRGMNRFTGNPNVYGKITNITSICL